MSRILEYSTPTGPVFIEIAGAQLGPSGANGTGVRKAGIGDASKQFVEKASQSFEAALSNAISAANVFVQSATKIEIQPDELNIEFGLKLSGDIDLFVVTATTEANFVVKMKWNKDGRTSTK